MLLAVIIPSYYAHGKFIKNTRDIRRLVGYA